LDVEQIQIDGWRRLSPGEKASLISGLTRAAHELARAGIQHRYPDAGPREQFLRLGVVVLGDELAREVYPDLATLDRP
jgi:hypothetical protein